MTEEDRQVLEEIGTSKLINKIKKYKKGEKTWQEFIDLGLPDNFKNVSELCIDSAKHWDSLFKAKRLVEKEDGDTFINTLHEINQTYNIEYCLMNQKIIDLQEENKKLKLKLRDT